MRRSTAVVFVAILFLGPSVAFGQDQTTNGPAPSATPAPTSDPGLPPLWRVYYDRGVTATRNRDAKTALAEFGKAKQELAKTPDPDRAKWMAEINTQLGHILLELGKSEKSSYTRENYLMSARQHFGWARRTIADLHGRDSLAYADATELLADARSAYAEHRAGELRYYRLALGPQADTKQTPADMYLQALRIREKELGESARPVMRYRRKVQRVLYKWVRTARDLRREITDVRAEYEYDPVIAGWKALADELKQRDRELRRRSRNHQDPGDLSTRANCRGGSARYASSAVWTDCMR